MKFSLSIGAILALAASTAWANNTNNNNQVDSGLPKTTLDIIRPDFPSPHDGQFSIMNKSPFNFQVTCRGRMRMNMPAGSRFDSTWWRFDLGPDHNVMHFFNVPNDSGFYCEFESGPVRNTIYMYGAHGAESLVIYKDQMKVSAHIYHFDPQDSNSDSLGKIMERIKSQDENVQSVRFRTPEQDQKVKDQYDLYLLNWDEMTVDLNEFRPLPVRRNEKKQQEAKNKANIESDKRQQGDMKPVVNKKADESQKPVEKESKLSQEEQEAQRKAAELVKKKQEEWNELMKKEYGEHYTAWLKKAETFNQRAAKHEFKDRAEYDKESQLLLDQLAEMKKMKLN